MSAIRNLLADGFDRRVLAALGVVGVGIWFLAPQLIVMALPFLLLLACPLSMALMAWTMRVPPAHTANGGDSRTPQAFYDAE